jgi:hypothetical protein
MKLTRKDKLAIQQLLSAGQILSNIGFNLGQRELPQAAQCRDAYHKWDAAYSEAKQAIRKLQLPPF